VELLLITTRWPHSDSTEFLDDEIQYLAAAFNRVVVAPMRPKGRLARDLPRGMTIDYSLAEHLVKSWLSRGRPSRGWTAAIRASIPNRHGFGFTRADFARDARSWTWLRTSLLSRADATSVAGWATRSHVPDIAYTFWLGGHTVGLRDAWPGVPLVSRTHRYDLYAEAQGWQSIPFQAASVQSVDLLAAVSEEGRAYLASRYPESADKIVVRRLGVPDLGLPTGAVSHSALRILSASSVTPAKRVDRILELAKAIARSGTEVEWTHLGDGPGKLDVQRAAAQRPGSLTVDLRGHVPREQVHRELQSGDHDVFVNVSLSEGAPVSLMEAQCVGLVTVATAVGGTPEVVRGDLNELVHPEASVAELSEAVLRAARRPLEQAQQRRNHWARLYNAAANYSAWADELAQLASLKAERR
jgi:glycosyltransferase involved in cell wall biosynthesis